MKKIMVVLSLIILLGYFAVSKEWPKVNLSLDKISKAIIYKCADANTKSVCYEEEIPKLTNVLTMEQTFDVTGVIQSKVADFPYCHVLGHKLASIETKKDPSQWKSVMARCPAGTCSNGCVHGAFQERYKYEDLSKAEFVLAKKDFETVCEKSDSFNPTGLEQGSCYHALGHLMMYLTNADIKESVIACDEVALKSDGRDFRNVCYAGAFMQIYQPLDTDDKSLVSKFNLNSENSWQFCSTFEESKRNACWEESWPVFLQQISVGRGLLDFCGMLGTGSEKCVRDLLYIMPIQFRFDYKSIWTFCKGLTQKYQGQCFAMTASRILEIDKRNGQKTIDFCMSLDTTDKDVCLNQLLTDLRFDFTFGSPGYNSVCDKLPEPWKSRCFSK